MAGQREGWEVTTNRYSFLVGQVKVLWDQIAVIVVHVVKAAERSVLKWLKW